MMGDMEELAQGTATAPVAAMGAHAAVDATALTADCAETDGVQAAPQAVAQPLQLSDLPDADAVSLMPPERQWRRVHAAAVAQNLDAYIDPATGYQVWTRLYLRKKGPCCGNACRHCPYGHENVPKSAAKSASA